MSTSSQFGSQNDQFIVDNNFKVSFPMIPIKAMGNYNNQPLVVGGGQGKKVEIYQKEKWNELDDYPFVDE